MCLRIRVTQKNDFESQTSTHMSAYYAFSKIREKFQNQIPKESDQNFDISRISQNLLIHFQLLEIKKSLTEKSYGDSKSRNSTYVLQYCPCPPNFAINNIFKFKSRILAKPFTRS